MTLAQRLLALHAALEDAALPHAFGGAIALAFWTEQPRGTRDLDVNVFVDAEQAERVLAALPPDVRAGAADRDALATTGQRRLWWDDTPVDLFLDYAPIHVEAARNRRTVTFEATAIPVLGPTELAAFKLMFDRTKDWADVEAMAAAGTLDTEAVAAHLRVMVGASDRRLQRLRALAG